MQVPRHNREVSIIQKFDSYSWENHKYKSFENNQTVSIIQRAASLIQKFDSYSWGNHKCKSLVTIGRFQSFKSLILTAGATTSASLPKIIRQVQSFKGRPRSFKSLILTAGATTCASPSSQSGGFNHSKV